ncbi:MAG: hypothetical protein J6R66_05050 [Clostridia bacterium]|nr:hypothetical protein [Clostridia bacterium]
MKKDLSTKIISLLFAIFLWFYIIQVQSPEIEKTIKNVPVQFTKSELENRGLALINDKEVEIDVKIRGQRKYLTNIKKADITIIADVSNIDSIGEHKIYTTVYLPYGNVEVLEQRPSQITVTVEEMVEVEKDVRINTLGEPKDGYCVGDIKTTPEKIKVKGPKSIVNSISYLAADVDVEDRDEDVSTIEDLYLVGESGTALNSPYVSFDPKTADIHCPILKKKTVEIDVRFADGVNNTLERYELDENSLKSIEIAGTAAAIKDLDKIYTKRITVDMIKKSGEVEVGLELPEGIKSLDGEKVTLKLKKVSLAN